MIDTSGMIWIWTGAIVFFLYKWNEYWTRSKEFWVVEICAAPGDWFVFEKADGTPVKFSTEEAAEVVARRLYPARAFKVTHPAYIEVTRIQPKCSSRSVS